MMNLKLASNTMELAEVQNATQIAYPDVQKPKIGGKSRKSPTRRIEKAALRLADAAEQLETLLIERGDAEGIDDVHEALGRIMEIQQLFAVAHARLRRSENDAAA